VDQDRGNFRGTRHKDARTRMASFFVGAAYNLLRMAPPDGEDGLMRQAKGTSPSPPDDLHLGQTALTLRLTSREPDFSALW
jgi:hypothetical protein